MASVCGIKRLEKERFHWPESESDVIEMQGRELSWLLEGLKGRTVYRSQKIIL